MVEELSATQDAYFHEIEQSIRKLEDSLIPNPNKNFGKTLVKKMLYVRANGRSEQIPYSRILMKTDLSY